jgi:transposase
MLKRKGRTGRRPFWDTPANPTKDQIRIMLDEGYKKGEIAERYRISKSVLSQLLKKYKLNGKRTIK